MRLLKSLLAALIIITFSAEFALAKTGARYVCADYYNIHTGKLISGYPSILEKHREMERDVITWRGRGLNPLKPDKMFVFRGLKVAEGFGRGIQRDSLYVMLGGWGEAGSMLPNEFPWQLERGYPVLVQEVGPNLHLFLIEPQKLTEKSPVLSKTTCTFFETNNLQQTPED